MKLIKTFLPLALLCSACLAQAQVSLRVKSKDGEPVGIMTVKYDFDEEGGVTWDMKIEQETPMGKTNFHFVSKRKNDGTPTVDDVTVNSAQGETKLHVDYGDKSATLTISGMVDFPARKVPAPGDLPIIDPSEFWFIREMPEKGAEAKFSSFSPMSGEWTKVEATYLGEEEVQVGVQKMKSHHVQRVDDSGTTHMYLDDKGYPLLIKTPEMVFERIIKS